MARWNSCNVLDASGELRQLWQFTPTGDGLKQVLEVKALPSETLPLKVIAKDWQTLYQKKLNIAWLPEDKVFLRAVQIPCDNVAEAKSMIELQLEKVSAVPVNQVVWSFELLPGVLGPLRTALVVIAERTYVEEFLGSLEGQGYLADRLDVPFIDQLLATRVTHDGAYIYPGIGTDPHSCLAAWFYSGLLQTLSIVRLPAGDEEGAQALKVQLQQTAWAGEVEGWLTSAPRCHLVADPDIAAVWEPRLAAVFDAPVHVVAPLADSQLAALTARRAAHTAPTGDLLPSEFLIRYRQQLIDRIWMRGLGAVVLLYFVGVLLYLGAIQLAQFQYTGLETEFRRKGADYTNAMKLKAEIQVRQDQLDLQWAALECYKAAAELLPDGLWLDGLNFSRGKILSLWGSAPADSAAKASDYSEALRKATDQRGQPLFMKVEVPQLNNRAGIWSWRFDCQLKPAEGE